MASVVTVTTDETETAFEGYTFSEMDRYILSLKDEEYELLTWERIGDIISRNALDELTRVPSSFRQYISWSLATQRTHGSVTAYIRQHRLPPHWLASPTPPPLPPTPPLGHRDDWCILRNDWPYGVAAGIWHLVVWSRVGLPVDEEGEGELTAEGRVVVEGFVEREIRGRLLGGSGSGGAEVVWFKNGWRGQSVRALEHFHVFVRGVEEDAVDKLTMRG